VSIASGHGDFNAKSRDRPAEQRAARAKAKAKLPIPLQLFAAQRAGIKVLTHRTRSD